MVVAVIWLVVVNDAFTVVDGECVEDGFPSVGITDEVLAVLPAFRRCEVQHFHRGLFGWEMAAVSD